MKHRWLSCALAALMLLSRAAAEIIPLGTEQPESLPTAAPVETAAPETEPAENDPEAETEAAAAPSVTEQGLTLGIHSLRYPQVSGLADAEIEAQLNQAIRDAGGIAELSARLPLVMSGSMPLLSDSRVAWEGGVFSCVLRAEGPLTDTRWEERRACVNMDTESGRSIALADLFTDGEAALERLAGRLEEMQTALSAHLMEGSLTPVPGVFGIDGTGLTLYYPMTQYTRLNGHCGAVHFTWGELREELDLTPGSLLDRFGVPAQLTLNDKSAEAIRRCAEAGSFPGFPAALGDDCAEIKAAIGLETDPDFFTDGRLLSPDTAICRGCWLMTDRLREKDLTGSVVQGLRADRISLWGLCTGVTTRAEWQAVLGSPDSSVTLGADAAEGLRMVPGISDYYRLGERLLRLHADEDGILRTVILQ